MSSVASHQPWPRATWIGGLIVDGSQQGAGIGRAATATLLQWLATKPKRAVLRLSYHPEDVAAARLYESLGFRPTGAVEDDEVVAERAVH